MVSIEEVQCDETVFGPHKWFTVCYMKSDNKQLNDSIYHQKMFASVTKATEFYQSLQKQSNIVVSTLINSYENKIIYSGSSSCKNTYSDTISENQSDSNK